MRIEKLVFFLIVLVISSCKPVQLLSLQKEKPVILKEESPEIFHYWEIDNDQNLMGFDLGTVPALREYRDSLNITLGKVKAEKAILFESSQNRSKDLFKNEKNGDKINALLVHTGTVGKIRKINLLEAQILNYQISRFPLLSHPTEFHGFIALHEKTNKIRIYFASSDTPWPPQPHIIIRALDEDLKKGWHLKYHLHNHYEKETNNYVGILAPSLADAQYFKMLSERFKVETTLITNGFHTVEIKPNEFNKFESH